MATPKSFSNVHQIVVLGASYAGLSVAHSLLKAIPNLESHTNKKYKVTLIANSSRFWFSVGAPRAILKEYPKSIDDSFVPVADGFAKYPAERVEFILAEITGLDTSKRAVSYNVKTDEETISKTTSSLHFDTIVVATGSTGDSPLYALQGSYLPTYRAYKDIQARIPSAKTVLVVGGGPAGVETAGELGYAYGKDTSATKDITLLSGSERLLSNVRKDVGAKAEEMLGNQGVKVVHNLRLKDWKKLPDGGEEAILSDGSSRKVDVLLVATGRHPTSTYLPSNISRNEKGQVNVDEYLRIPDVESAWATGDIASLSDLTIVSMTTLVPTAVSNILVELSGKGKLKVWKHMAPKGLIVVPVGPTGGVGVLFGYWLPSFAARFIKAKTFMFEKAKGYTTDSAF